MTEQNLPAETGPDPRSADEVQPSTIGAAHRASVQAQPTAQDLGYGDSLKDKVAALAYCRWQERGCPLGSSDVDWYEAEQELHAKP